MKKPFDFTEESIGNAALDYARRGWAVFPIHSIETDGRCGCGSQACPAQGKHPLVQGGFKAATTDVQVIRGWWTDKPNANVAIATGSRSGVVVLDIDPRHGGDKSFVELCGSFDFFFNDTATT